MPAEKTTIDERTFRIALAARGWPQWKVAACLGVSPSELSAYRRGRRFLSPDLVSKLERILGLEAGALSRTANAALV